MSNSNQIKVGGLATEPDYTIDVNALQLKYDKRRNDPRQIHYGSFSLDSEIQGGRLEQESNTACSRFEQAMIKKGWDLASQFNVVGPFSSHDIDSNLVLLGRSEYRIRAVFKPQNTPKPVRIEIPTGLVKRDPEHLITLAEAVKAR
jgi:hypothetical protein